LENKKYDLEKAKEDCRRHEDALEEAQSCMCGHCHECGFDPAEMKAALDEIDQQAKQIEALKEKLVEERAQVLAGKGNLIWEPLPDDDRPDGLYPALVIRGKAYWRTVAHQQIEAEMVGVEWE
jgi:hypothetical protein